MAETTTEKTGGRSGNAEPVLRPGRPADPGGRGSVPAGTADGDVKKQPATSANPAANRTDPVNEPDKPTGSTEGRLPEPATAPGQAKATEVGNADATTNEDAEKRFAESRQRRLRRLLRQCERVTLMDFNTLAMTGWPDNFSLSMARRRRDIWLLGASIAALVFLSGMTGFVPAWFAGGGFGAFVVILLLGVPPVRRLYSVKPSYLDLLLQRQQMLRDARKHIAHLEGSVGLIWQCNELAEFNPALGAARFSTLRHLSEQRRLTSSLNQREHIRLYLIFLLEAEKAYERMQSVYFEGHQQAIDRGWQSVAATTIDKGSDKAGDEATPNKGEAP